jgi:hypothetical protein
MEFPWALGPPDGRYVLRRTAGSAPADAARDSAPADPLATHVIVLATLGAAERRHGRRRGRGRPAAPAPSPTPVETARVTVVDADGTDPAAAEAWLERADAATAQDALRQLAAMLRAQRLATADPALHTPGLSNALVVRAGYGAGEEVADGRWTRALELPTAEHERRRRRRTDALRPQERLSALLGGRAHVLACEELTLRARQDLDHGNLREGALQLRAALDAALAELPATPGAAQLTERIEELRARRGEVVALADAAIGGVLDADAAQTLEQVLGRLEAALRARAVAEHG